MGEENLALKGHTHENYADKNKIAGNLTTTDASMVLAATMGKQLNERLGAVRELYRAHLNPVFSTVECTPSGGEFDYFVDWLPYKFYIKSMDERYYMTLDSNLSVLKQVGTAADIGVYSIPRYEICEVTFVEHEGHGSAWYERSEIVMQSGRLIVATKKFKIMVSESYNQGHFDYLCNGLGNLQQCHRPTPPQYEYEDHYLLKIY